MYSFKNIFSFLILLIATLICTGCSSISVNQDYDPEYDFSKLKTYGFIPLSSEAGIDQPQVLIN
ncbi:MAG: hypothetical protein IPM14_14265 [bacterium]|nr:hypothetical protein [bacterium]